MMIARCLLLFLGVAALAAAGRPSYSDLGTNATSCASDDFRSFDIPENSALVFVVHGEGAKCSGAHSAPAPAHCWQPALQALEFPS